MIIACDYDGRGQDTDIEQALADPFYPRFWPEKVKNMDMFGKKKTYAVNIRNPKGIFVCDMGELFGDWVPEHWQKSIFLAIKSNPQYRFYLLTKQPQNLIKFSPFPDNCWVGVTATNWEMAHQAMYHLGFVDAKVKFISAEPLLAPFTDPDPIDSLKSITAHEVVGDIDWLIIGAQTNPYKPPKIEWVREIVEAADKAGVPVFLKDNLDPLLRTTDGQIPTGLCDNYGHTLRQEMPE